jgi:hypothetical protein
MVSHKHTKNVVNGKPPVQIGTFCSNLILHLFIEFEFENRYQWLIHRTFLYHIVKLWCPVMILITWYMLFHLSNYKYDIENWFYSHSFNINVKTSISWSCKENFSIILNTDSVHCHMNNWVSLTSAIHISICYWKLIVTADQFIWIWILISVDYTRKNDYHILNVCSVVRILASC